MTGNLSDGGYFLSISLNVPIHVAYRGLRHFFISHLYYRLLNTNFNFIQLYILNICTVTDMSRFNSTNEELKLPLTICLSKTIKELNPS